MKPQKKKVGRPKGRKDSRPRKKKTTFAQRSAAAKKAAETRRRKAAEQAKAPVAAPSTPAGVKDAQAGVTAKDGTPDVVPYPQAGDNPAFREFLREETIGQAPGSTDNKATVPTPGGDAGAPPAWTSPAIQDAYKGIGDMIHAVSGDPADKLQPYELRMLSCPNNVRFVNKHLGAADDNLDAYIFAGTNGIVLGPRIGRNVKPLLQVGKGLLSTLLALLGVPLQGGKPAQKPKPTPSDGFGDIGTPDHE